MAGGKSGRRGRGGKRGGGKRGESGGSGGPVAVKQVRIGENTMYVYSSFVPPGREDQTGSDRLVRMPGSGDRESDMEVMRAAALGEKGSRESRRIYRAVLARYPNHYAANCNLGVDLRLSGRPRSALKYFARAIKVWPENHMAYAGMGRALVDMGDHKMAIKFLDMALEIQPDDPLALKSRRMAAKKLEGAKRRRRRRGRAAEDAA